MEKGSCEFCRFWNKEDETCRRYPPQILYIPSTGLRRHEWPVTAPDEWCGEGKPEDGTDV